MEMLGVKRLDHALPALRRVHRDACILMTIRDLAKRAINEAGNGGSLLDDLRSGASVAWILWRVRDIIEKKNAEAVVYELTTFIGQVIREVDTPP